MASRLTLRWIAHAELSAAHAAFVVATGAPCTDRKTEQILIEPVTDINNRLLSSSLDVSLFWHGYLNEIMDAKDLEDACWGALLASGCSELQVEQVSKAIRRRLSDSRHAFQRRFPKLAEQLELRAGPLRDRWDTYGPGLLDQVGRMVWETSPPMQWWPSPITAMLVQPTRGGDGGYDFRRDRFWIEAMLTDVDPAVPEVLRVAWLVTRMAIDGYLDREAADNTLSVPWSLVSVPLVLAAAQELELIRDREPPIGRAMELWQFGDEQIAATLQRWWKQHTASPQPLPAALKVLAQAEEVQAIR